nr:hypothetical protein KitaXyl93_15590 [Kitasatospora sp. Xyl93]
MHGIRPPFRARPALLGAPVAPVPDTVERPAGPAADRAPGAPGGRGRSRYDRFQRAGTFGGSQPAMAVCAWRQV